MDARGINETSLARSAAALAWAAGLVLACTESPTESPTDTAPTYTVGGTVSGLVGIGLVLRDNGGDNLAVTANGAFSFATGLADGAAYAVTVSTQPSEPDADLRRHRRRTEPWPPRISRTSQSPARPTPTPSAARSRAWRDRIVLRDNGGDDLAVTANGTFTFATPLASGAAYSVTVFADIPPRPASSPAAAGRWPCQRHGRRHRVRDERRHGDDSGDDGDHRPRRPRDLPNRCGSRRPLRVLVYRGRSLQRHRLDRRGAGDAQRIYHLLRCGIAGSARTMGRSP